MAGSGDIFGTALSGLRAFQNVLHTTSHNITNAATEGYSRQSVTLSTRDPAFLGGRSVGTGVDVTSVRRMQDEFVNARERNYTSNFNYEESFFKFASQVNEMLANPSANMGQSMQGFFDSLQEVADHPSSLPTREVMFANSEMVVDRFHMMFDQLGSYRAQINNDISVVSTQLNQLAASVADLNDEITTLGGSAGAFPPNDLLDRRDQLIREMSSIVNISTVAQDDGAVNVFIGKGQALVLSGNANAISVIPNEFDSRQMEVAFVGSGTPVAISNYLSGGELGALIANRNGLITQTENTLGQMAVSMADNFNQQHRLGMDMNGNIGQDFFSEPEPAVFASINNGGDAELVVAFTDTNQLGTDDYRLNFDGSNYVLVNNTTNTRTAVPGFPYDSGAGFSIDIASGTMNAGDSFLIRPTYMGANTIELAIDNVQQIAAASPIASASSLNNTGQATISGLAVSDVTDPALLNAIEIQFTSVAPDQYDIIDTASGLPINTGLAYTSGSPIAANGWELTLTGAPALGDSFSVGSNQGGVGDNSNALALADLQSADVMENSTASLQDVYSSLVARVGVQTGQAEASMSAQQALMTQAQVSREQVSGVNLDEEAANLLKYQQAYEAAARVMTTANSMFQTLLDAFR